MKTKISIFFSAVALWLFISSCTDMQKSSLDNGLPAVKEKKEPRLAKAKKKERKKISVVKKKTGKTTSGSGGPIDASQNSSNASESTAEANSSTLNFLADKALDFSAKNDLSTKYCFLIDMSITSGRKRFFVYDLEKNSVILAGLVAHGSCNQQFLSRPRFSNAPNCGCSSLGKYKVGELYNGKYGKSFRLYGLDYSNSNAFKRGVVIHGYDCVPDHEISPMVLCNSEGCPMVSYSFFGKLSRLIKQSDKPILLWIYQ